jgi:ATP-binding cassette subfamily B (MDR/TAP) protein 1
MIDAFQNNSQIFEEAKKNLYYYLVLGVAAGVTAMAMFTGWTIAGERQSIECRKQYFRSILRQEVAWFDTQKQV